MFRHVRVLQPEVIKGLHCYVDLWELVDMAQVDLPRVAGDQILRSC